MAADRDLCFAGPHRGAGHRRNKRGKSEWVELDLDGKPLGRYPLQGFGFTHAAITADDRIFTQNGYHQPLLLLNRATGKWNAMPLGMTHQLFGSDGEQLVYSTWEHGSVVLERGDTRGLPMSPSSIADLR